MAHKINIWGPHTLLPENLSLFRECVRGAAKDLVETGKLDYEWMCYYDDHFRGLDKDGKEIPDQDISDEEFKLQVMRVYNKMVGRVGPEWTVERDLPFYSDYEGRVLNPDKVVAFKSSEKTKMRDFEKRSYHSYWHTQMW